jgi:ATP-binding protein involved in chromosome partitioning
MKKVEDPELHKDIVSMGMIKDISINGDKVAFTLELTTPACPFKNKR